ncbi:MAG: hypothetical protein IT374_13980 [Polyangiaceae bacterium]|nr:hypothetical protein [Polyangiaceae bacterium]
MATRSGKVRCWGSNLGGRIGRRELAQRRARERAAATMSEGVSAPRVAGRRGHAPSVTTVGAW